MSQIHFAAGKFAILACILLLSVVTMSTGARESEPSSDEQTSENDRSLRRMLSRYPKANTNGDGILTMSEARAFMDKLKREKVRRRGSPVPAKLKELYEDRKYTGKPGQELRYYLMKPQDYDPGQKYPLVLCLHGSGGSTQAAGALSAPEMRAEYPCFVLAPEALVSQTWSDRQRGLVENVQPLVLKVIEALQKEFSIDADRLYVTGQSMGGGGTYSFIINNPGMFAAAVPVCGPVDPLDAKIITNVPIWVFHGSDDSTVPVKYSRDIVEALKEAGGKPKYTEFKGVKHNSWVPTYKTEGLWEWLFAQKRNATPISE